MDKKNSAKLVLTQNEKVIVRCYFKNIVKFGAFTDNISFLF